MSIEADYKAVYLTERTAREQAERERDEATENSHHNAATAVRAQTTWRRALVAGGVGIDTSATEINALETATKALVAERDAIRADLDALRRQLAALNVTTGAVSERARLIADMASRLWQRTTWGGSDEDVSARVTAFAAVMLRAAEAEARKGGEEAGRG